MAGSSFHWVVEQRSQFRKPRVHAQAVHAEIGIPVNGAGIQHEAAAVLPGPRDLGGDQVGEVQHGAAHHPMDLQFRRVLSGEKCARLGSRDGANRGFEARHGERVARGQ